MRCPLFIGVILVSIMVASSDSTVNRDHPFAYSPNTGWLNGRGDVSNGAVLGEYICSGFIWGPNIGWIHLGQGAPANGIRYQNNSATDFGVNHDGSGNLRGYAYGANVGWIHFETSGAPRVSLQTGRLSGHAWSANCGWISLSNSVNHLQTDTLRPGADTDGDGITDAWELIYTNTLTAFTASTDTDGDGVSDRDEHGADTHPVDASALLRITDYEVTFAGGEEADTITWTTQPTRLYLVQSETALGALPLWTDASPLIGPEPGPEATRVLSFPSSSTRRYFRVRAQKPLAP